jgi:hypothetical protein
MAGAKLSDDLWNSTGLLARVEITTYNPHLGLLRPEHGEDGHHTVYAGRREADVVTTSCVTLLPIGGRAQAVRTAACYRPCDNGCAKASINKTALLIVESRQWMTGWRLPGMDERPVSTT